MPHPAGSSSSSSSSSSRLLCGSVVQELALFEQLYYFGGKIVPIAAVRHPSSLPPIYLDVGSLEFSALRVPRKPAVSRGGLKHPSLWAPVVGTIITINIPAVFVEPGYYENEHEKNTFSRCFETFQQIFWPSRWKVEKRWEKVFFCQYIKIYWRDKDVGILVILCLIYNLSLIHWVGKKEGYDMNIEITSQLNNQL